MMQLLFNISQFWIGCTGVGKEKASKEISEAAAEVLKAVPGGQVIFTRIYRFASAQMFDFAFSDLGIREPLTFKLVMSQFGTGNQCVLNKRLHMIPCG